MDKSSVCISAIILVTCCTTAQGMEILDMSYILDENAPMWGPGLQDTPTLIDLAKVVGAQDVGAFNNFHSGEHVGTHMDAPVHVKTPGGTFHVHEIPLEKLYGTAVQIDVRNKITGNNSNYELSVADILEHEKKYGEIPQNGIVFACTGWSAKVGNPEQYWGGNRSDGETWNFPGFSGEAATWLIANRSIKGVAVDSGACDSGRNCGHGKLYAHKALFAANTWCVENVVNACKLPQQPDQATVYMFPNKVRGGSGTQVRVVAFIGRKPEQLTSGGGGLPVLSVGIWKTFLVILMSVVLGYK